MQSKSRSEHNLQSTVPQSQDEWVKLQKKKEKMARMTRNLSNEKLESRGVKNNGYSSDDAIDVKNINMRLSIPNLAHIEENNMARISDRPKSAHFVEVVESPRSRVSDYKGRNVVEKRNSRGSIDYVQSNRPTQGRSRDRERDRDSRDRHGRERGRDKDKERGRGRSRSSANALSLDKPSKIAITITEPIKMQNNCIENDNKITIPLNYIILVILICMIIFTVFYVVKVVFDMATFDFSPVAVTESNRPGPLYED